MKIVKKEKEFAGADERTPSKAEYFSWISSTNEGSTEKQTLVNLDYFAYLKREYGMQLDIYAWDAGNLDGAEGTYETFDSPKIKAQYPNGYAAVAEAAKKLGCRMGVWGGIDGFGETQESAEARTEQMVSLARDYNFALFKFDTVCGFLRDSSEKYFIKMMKECRRHVPDFILLNHRIPLGDEAERYATTFLWEGVETYVDVHISGSICAPHHRSFIMDRGQTPNMVRLTEDHGVCLSSHLDFFEDDLIIQAFSRSLILAPQIYGNPWLLRDHEQAHLARIFNLHRKYRDILVDGFVLSGEDYPRGTVVRGDGKRRFIVGGNMDWNVRYMSVRLDLSIGLEPCERVAVAVHHPYEKYVGELAYGETVKIPIEPFRAVLVKVCDAAFADVMLTGCEYEVLREDGQGGIRKVKILSSCGNIGLSNGKELLTTESFDNTLREPILLGEIDSYSFEEAPADSEKQLETALFVQDHDSLEKRSLDRAGETGIPEVKAAREAFFAQETYRARGCESRFAFDGEKDTFFDGISRAFFLEDGFRVDKGCLRVDFGDEFDADEVHFEFFDPDESDGGYFATALRQSIPDCCDFSVDLADWKKTSSGRIISSCRENKKLIVSNLHSFKEVSGERKTVTYPINGRLRYMRMPAPLDHIYKIALVKDGSEIPLTAPRANNLLPYGREALYSKAFGVRVSSQDFREGCYICVCLEGVHGREGAYAVLECDGEYIGAPDRSPGYGTNAWECYAIRSFEQDHHYTYYFPVERDMCDKDITVRVLGVNGELRIYGVRAFLCDGNRELDGILLDL